MLSKEQIEAKLYAAEKDGKQNLYVSTESIRTLICEIDSYRALEKRLERYPVAEAILDALEELDHRIAVLEEA